MITELQVAGAVAYVPGAVRARAARPMLSRGAAARPHEYRHVGGTVPATLCTGPEESPLYRERGRGDARYPGCYGIAEDFVSAGSWQSFFFYGGLGKSPLNPGCP